VAYRTLAPAPYRDEGKLASGYSTARACRLQGTIKERLNPRLEIELRSSQERFQRLGWGTGPFSTAPSGEPDNSKELVQAGNKSKFTTPFKGKPDVGKAGVPEQTLQQKGQRNKTRGKAQKYPAIPKEDPRQGTEEGEQQPRSREKEGGKGVDVKLQSLVLAKQVHGPGD
jgi:hypothetical protein